MGYNTTVVVLNDALGTIRNDPEFGRRLYEAVLEVQRGKPVAVPARSGNRVHCNAAIVVETHHANNEVTVIVGGNTGRLATPASGGPRDG